MTDEYCGDCDGVGWVEGGESLQTTCSRCNGTGVEPLYNSATFDVDGAPFPPHVLDALCWCDPTIEAIYGLHHPKALAIAAQERETP